MMSAPSTTAPRLTAVEENSSVAALQALAQRLQLAVGPRFEVLRHIAIGGMAVLFQLRHRLHGGFFVAKVLHPHLAEWPEIVASFRAEATHAAALSAHPNVVPVFDLAVFDGLFLMLMPFIEGEDLDHLLQRAGPLSRAEALMLAAQMSSALSFAETRGIAHCDVSPGNIRLDQLGLYRLLDFGLSRRREGVHGDGASGEKRRSSLGGTPAYLSPEQVQGEMPDARSDLYALGLVVLESLLGRHPCDATNVKEVEYWHGHGRIVYPPEIAVDLPLVALLERLLAKDRAERFQSAFEVSGVLAAMGCALPEFRVKRGTEGVSAEAPAGKKRRLSAL